MIDTIEEYCSAYKTNVEILPSPTGKDAEILLVCRNTLSNPQLCDKNCIYSSEAQSQALIARMLDNQTFNLNKDKTIPIEFLRKKGFIDYTSGRKKQIIIRESNAETLKIFVTPSASKLDVAAIAAEQTYQVTAGGSRKPHTPKVEASRNQSSSGPRRAFRIWKTIKLGTGLRNADDFRNALDRGGYKVLDWGNAILGARGFTATKIEQEVKLVRVTVEDLGFHEVRSEILYGDRVMRSEIYGRAMALGLKLCPAEVGPQLRLQYPEQPYNESLVIGMESITDLQSDLSIFCVEHNDRGRWLGGAYGDPDGFWRRNRTFVFACE